MGGMCDVIIPSKNSPWWLAICLEELFRNTDAEELGQVIVVDDGSTPDAYAVIERICAKYKGVRLLKNGGRPGFGGNCNFGVKHSTAPFLLFLNTDCLITKNTIRKLISACTADEKVGLSCPLSNNSPCLTLPFLAGHSYFDMNAVLEEASQNLPMSQIALDACLVVGNCLLITRKCWDKVGEFSEIWGQGYGEESDYQMRALELGFRGVALTNTYVFHYGNGTFRYEAKANDLRTKNHALFLSKWGDNYKALAAKQEHNDPILVALRRIATLPPKTLKPDVLFILPGLAQGVGGIHTVVDICNHLLHIGVDAKVAVLGPFNPDNLKNYQEPIFAGLLHFVDELAMLRQTDVIPKCIAPTLFTTTPPSYVFASFHRIPLTYFVQGYECLFENGVHYSAVEDTYALADYVIVTSGWLKSRINLHVPEKPVALLPIGLDLDMFTPKQTPPKSNGKMRLGMVLRDAQDKGQWILLDLLKELAQHRDKIELTVLAASKYKLPFGWDKNNCRQFTLPLDRAVISAELADCDVLVDASLHEGFGLIPLEAMACGATVVLSDSGGVKQYLRHNENGILITEINRPDKYAAAILSLASERPRLNRLKSEALKTAQEFDAAKVYGDYATFFKKVISTFSSPDAKNSVVAQVFRKLPAVVPPMKVHEDLVAHLRATTTAQDQRIHELIAEKSKVMGGLSFRIGRILTAPLRLFTGKG